MAAPQDPRSHVELAGYEPLIATVLGIITVVSTVAALAVILRSPTSMLLIVLLYAVAFASAFGGLRFGRSRGNWSNGFKMLATTVVLACLISVVIWTVTDTWSLIGTCERREKTNWRGETEFWYEGTACTESELDWRGYSN